MRKAHVRRTYGNVSGVWVGVRGVLQAHGWRVGCARKKAVWPLLPLLLPLVMMMVLMMR